MASGDGQNGAQARKSYDRGVGIIEIYTIYLCKASRNEARFVFVYSAVGFAFNAEDPFAANNILIGRSRNFFPSFGFAECVTTSRRVPPRLGFVFLVRFVSVIGSVYLPTC